MMTKKNFEAIAHVLDANHAPLSLVQDFADMLEEENPRFDRTLFIAASTVTLLDLANYEAMKLRQAHGIA